MNIMSTWREILPLFRLFNNNQKLPLHLFERRRCLFDGFVVLRHIVLLQSIDPDHRLFKLVCKPPRFKLYLARASGYVDKKPFNLYRDLLQYKSRNNDLYQRAKGSLKRIKTAA